MNGQKIQKHILTQVVASGYCIGCGVCAGMCPHNVLSVEFNQAGEYRPVLQGSCRDCELCLRVCPFGHFSDGEDVLAQELFLNISSRKHDEAVGYYQNCYLGYSNKGVERQNGASGGLARWTLSALLRFGYVDNVICVVPHPSPGKLFRYTCLSTPDALAHVASSAYYPTEISDFIGQIGKKSYGRVAITGLPCMIKAIRLAAKASPAISQTELFLLGLVCGQLKSAQYTQYLARSINIHGDLAEVNYRGKNSDQPANNFHFSCSNSKGERGIRYWRDGIAKIWNNRWFTPNACNYCDDIFAELADISFMDAWLPDAKLDSRGTNIIVTRSDAADHFIQMGIERKEVELRKVDIDQARQSQAAVIKAKRQDIQYRLFAAYRKGKTIPDKRMSMSNRMPYLERLEIAIKERIRRLSRFISLKEPKRDICQQIIFIRIHFEQLKLSLVLYFRKVKLGIQRRFMDT